MMREKIHSDSHKICTKIINRYFCIPNIYIYILILMYYAAHNCLEYTHAYACGYHRTPRGMQATPHYHGSCETNHREAMIALCVVVTGY